MIKFGWLSRKLLSEGEDDLVERECLKRKKVIGCDKA